MPKFFTFLILYFTANVVLACSCAPQFPFKTKEDLKSYDFVALVQITKLSVLSSNRWMRLRVNGDIGVQVKELFKGDTTSAVHDYSYNSDCAFEMKVGEQWLLFGNNNKGQIFISKCGFSRIYRDSLGQRDWTYFSSIERLNKLRDIFGHIIIQNKDPKIYYPNGRVEIEQTFKNGKLDGIRKTYYPNGALYVAEKFKDGKRTGYRKIYMPSGQLISETSYKNNFIKQNKRYQDTAEHAWYINFKIHHINDLLFGDKNRSPEQYAQILDSLRRLKHWDKQISYRRKFMSGGKSYISEGFNYKGDTTFRAHLDWDKKISEEIHFLEDGKIEYTIKLDQNNNQQMERDYNRKDGPRDFNKTCEYCKFYFDESKPPEATPETVYY